MAAMNRLNFRNGKLLVIEHAPTRRTPDRWLCRCDCGLPAIFTGKELDRRTHCGCAHGIRHGHNRRNFTSPTYHSWTGMKSRCTNDKAPYYKNYGGRGIKVCARWMKFENFLADMGECPEGYSIERKDVNGNYEPDNCIWIPAADQTLNMRRTLRVVVNGQTLCASAAARLLGVKEGNFYKWISRYGMARAVERAQRLIT